MEKTIFVSKYSPNGKHVKTIGYSSDTAIPFYAGNCDAAINGNLLAVYYGRLMRNGHQSGIGFTVDINTMSFIKTKQYCVSHSFAQRVVPYKNYFLFSSEGDAYPRAFTVNQYETFHFWIEPGHEDDMSVVNNNFARMGGIAVAGPDSGALVGLSVPSLNNHVHREGQQLFIQVFNPTMELYKKEAYYTTGERSGFGYLNGKIPVTDYGVRWLTSLNGGLIYNPQVVATPSGKYVVLYEKAKNSYSYDGLYYLVLDSRGKILKKTTRFSKTALLNDCEMPVYSTKDKAIHWTSNTYDDATHLTVFSLPIK